MAGVLSSLGCLMLMSCGPAQSTGTSATPTTSASPSATPSPSHTPEAGWKTYISARWGYSIDYPGGWYDLANFGAPDTEKYFSNETVGAPLEMTARGVLETIEVRSNSTGSCPPPYVSTWANRQAPTTVDGVATTRYTLNMTPAGAEAAYIIGVWVVHNGNCFSIQFLSTTPTGRDANARVADQTIASFKFGS